MNGRQAAVAGVAVLANLAFLAPFLLAWTSAGDHIGVLSSRFTVECIRAVPSKPEPLPYPTARVTFQSPYVLRLTWAHTSTVVLCEYDLGDHERPDRVVRAWVAA